MTVFGSNEKFTHSFPFLFWHVVLQVNARGHVMQHLWVFVPAKKCRSVLCNSHMGKNAKTTPFWNRIALRNELGLQFEYSSVFSTALIGVHFWTVMCHLYIISCITSRPHHHPSIMYSMRCLFDFCQKIHVTQIFQNLSGKEKTIFLTKTSQTYSRTFILFNNLHEACSPWPCGFWEVQVDIWAYGFHN